MIAETQARGYAIRSEGEYSPKTASIAVPIVRNEIVFGCISIIWIRTALAIDKAIADFAAPLRDAAAAIPVD
jgi:IclR family mhp operon transcriptional activator